jgi:hypothetical protein
VPAHIGLNTVILPLHLFAKRPKCPDNIDTRFVPLLSLQTAHLRYERLGSADLHAVNHMRNLHASRLNLEEHRVDLSSASNIDRCKPFNRPISASGS